MSGVASAFSTSETSALERETEIAAETPVTIEQIWNETNRKICINWIKQNGYKRVCLQFPDDYLQHSNVISDSLKAQFSTALDIKVFILADTSYGSCCVDEIAAAHVDGDSIIHFGNACRSKVTRLPVLYMFPKFDMDFNKLYKKIETLKDLCRNKQTCVYLDIGYHQQLDDETVDLDSLSFIAQLRQMLNCIDLHVEAYPPPVDTKPDYVLKDDRICIFIGDDNLRFFNLSLTTKAEKWFIYSPVTDSLNEKNPLTANYIRRRYYYIEKCKDAKTLGLIVATLTTDGYLDVVTRLQDISKSIGVKTQIISVGRINPAKLANFLEIDCFVLIGCPFNNMYNSKEFYKPIVSVFEAEMALNPAWYMKYPEVYVTDFKQLLPEGSSFLPFESSNAAQQDVSLISGRVRNTDVDETIETAGASALTEQQQTLNSYGKMEIMTMNTGLTFEDRTWKGLDPALGCTEPAKLQKGLSGIPINYTHD